MVAKRQIVVGLTALLSGCVTNISPQTASGLSTAALCMQYGHWLRKENPQAVQTVSAELRRRGNSVPSNEEHGSILSERVTIGMSECGMLAAMGSPDRQLDTTTAQGRRTQYVFNRFAGRPGGVVYTEGARVVALQSY